MHRVTFGRTKRHTYVGYVSTGKCIIKTVQPTKGVQHCQINTCIMQNMNSFIDNKAYYSEYTHTYTQNLHDNHHISK